MFNCSTTIAGIEMVTMNMYCLRALRHWCMLVHLLTLLTAIRQFLPTRLHSSSSETMDLLVSVLSAFYISSSSVIKTVFWADNAVDLSQNVMSYMSAAMSNLHVYHGREQIEHSFFTL